ncbi:MAG: epsG [Gemmataceae bacterium]|nr:epsG [Gemmataceae bacterium]
MMLAHARRRATRRAAFTLLEVLVVVAILVILAGVGVVATTRYLDDAKKSKAQLQASTISKAMEAYHLNPNSGGTYPQSLQELISPAWGGSSFLNDPTADLTDPWNQQFQIQQAAASDNSIQGKPIVFTKAPDGVVISQYGVGPASRLQ